jgi:hypothetical protein
MWISEVSYRPSWLSLYKLSSMFAYSQKTKSHSCLWNFYALSLTKQKQQATQKKGEGSNSKSP